MQRLDSGGTSACRPVPPHGEAFRVFLILSCRVHFCRTQVPGNYGYRYPTSVRNESGSESIPGRDIECFRDKSAETWLHRDCLNEFGLHTLPPGILKIPAKPWPGPATIPHVRLRVSSATASLCSGKIPIRILTRTVHIHPTRREEGVFSRPAGTRVGSEYVEQWCTGKKWTHFFICWFSSVNPGRTYH